MVKQEVISKRLKKLDASEREKFFLFSKILENSMDVLKALNIFTVRDRKKMISKYTPPSFNHDFPGKRHKVLRYLVNNEQVHIPQLQWQI